jgi:pheromone shutdown protein TraB
LLIFFFAFYRLNRFVTALQTVVHRDSSVVQPSTVPLKPEVDKENIFIKAGKEDTDRFTKAFRNKQTVNELLEIAKQEIPALYALYIGDRDEYMTKQILSRDNYQVLVAVVGAAHVPGIKAILEEKEGFKS